MLLGPKAFESCRADAEGSTSVDRGNAESEVEKQVEPRGDVCAVDPREDGEVEDPSDESESSNANAYSRRPLTMHEVGGMPRLDAARDSGSCDAGPSRSSTSELFDVGGMVSWIDDE